MNDGYFYEDVETTANHFGTFGIHYDLLGELYELEENYVEARNLYEKALVKFAKGIELSDANDITEDYMICLRRLSAACVKIGKSEYIKGYNYIKECEKLCEERYKRAENSKDGWLLCVCYTEISAFHKDKIEGLENPELSEYYKKKAFDLGLEMKNKGFMAELERDTEDLISRLPYEVKF